MESSCSSPLTNFTSSLQTRTNKSRPASNQPPTSSTTILFYSLHFFNNRIIMSGGVKRDRDGNARVKNAGPLKQAGPRGRFHDMFEGFRDELDEHHDRRERIVKASRDVTAQSKKM